MLWLASYVMDKYVICHNINFTTLINACNQHNLHSMFLYDNNIMMPTLAKLVMVIHFSSNLLNVPVAMHY